MLPNTDAMSGYIRTVNKRFAAGVEFEKRKQICRDIALKYEAQSLK